MTIDVAIIGAGVSGLTTAYELTRAGHQVVVLERQVRPGGNARSEKSAAMKFHNQTALVRNTEIEVSRLERLPRLFHRANSRQAFCPATMPLGAHAAIQSRACNPVTPLCGSRIRKFRRGVRRRRFHDLDF